MTEYHSASHTTSAFCKHETSRFSNILGWFDLRQKLRVIFVLKGQLMSELLQRRDLVMWLAEGFKIGALARGGGEEDLIRPAYRLPPFDGVNPPWRGGMPGLSLVKSQRSVVLDS
ncbi:hypothetical protein RRG08_052628 [Elysia crispata]|uniref:Uncharacterized protein n=1 Tax=Elysia crispata TaxID=231223 RepID=A0AAE1AFK2_9GAST|nr:hypothetical protein RRG08_052628 [Elysia crispata]